MTPTAEQLAIIDAAQNSSHNLLVSALAGAAKTSTLVLIAKALPSVPILCLAFNKRIATEMQQRLPSNCHAKTLNGLGHMVWQDAIGTKLRLEGDKMFKILGDMITHLGTNERRQAYDGFADLLRTVKFAKACGYVPKGANRVKSLISADEFYGRLDDELPGWAIDVIDSCLIVSVREAWKGLIDYDDQILMPTLGIGAFPSYPLVLVDEAQDLSALNHAMLRRMVKKRIIAVGDRYQAIYGFRGAHEDSMNLLKSTFAMDELTLTISFRCPKAVTRSVHWRAPMMKSPEWAAEGEVRTLHEWGSPTIPPEAAILCRNNAPLFAMALQLLKSGRYPELVGNDIGKGLLKVMSKLGDAQMKRDEALIKVTEWVEEKKEGSRNPALWDDKAECIRVFLKATTTLGAAMIFAEHIFQSTGPIKLMSGHKSKGLEFENVFILDRHLIGKEKQDPNLAYVMATRAKSTLTYIRSEDYVQAQAA